MTCIGKTRSSRRNLLTRGSCTEIKWKKINSQKLLIDFVRSVLGQPHYSFSVTLNPVHGPRRAFTKTIDAEKAMSWFLHVLNSRCFGHAYRRKKFEVGIFAVLEGLGRDGQPHWHGVIRLPASLSSEHFLKAFKHAITCTKRFGRQQHLEPYYEGRWLEYITKLGMESIQPQFLRAGTR